MGRLCAMPLDFVLVTANAGKRSEAERIVGHALTVTALDLPEIQSLDLLEVLQAKGEEAFRRLGRPLVVEETGLYLTALGGFPGPLVKWMLEAVGGEGIARTVTALGDLRAEARCALLYTDGRRQIVGQGATRGALVLPPRGAGGFGWDPVFQPEGETQTFGELAREAKDRIGHRGRAWRDLWSNMGQALPADSIDRDLLL